MPMMMPILKPKEHTKIKSRAKLLL